MATPLADKIKTYFPSRVSTADGQALTPFVATAGLSVTEISDSVNFQADGYFNGAIGWFLETTTTVALRGQFFHVSNYASNKFTLSKPLPASPVIGDTFRVVIGGKYRTTQEQFGLLWNGKLPELVIPTTITGVSVKKVSALIGAGTLYLKYTTGVKELSISIDGGVTYGAVEAFLVNRTDIALYLPNSDGFIIVDVITASMPVGSSTTTYTITKPFNTLTPDYEGYESENSLKGKTRFRLEVFKNEGGGGNNMNNVIAYVANATPVQTTKTSGTVNLALSSMVVANAASYPAASFWLKNVTLNDIRYCDFRSGNTVNIPAVRWGKLSFNTGVLAFVAGDTITDFSTGATAIVDQIFISSGSFGGGNAVGVVTFKEFTGSSFTAGNSLRVSGTNRATISVTSALGYRDKIAQTWADGNVIELYPEIDIAFEIPVANLFASPVDEFTLPLPPTPLVFNSPTTFNAGLAVGGVNNGNLFGIWHREVIVDKYKARSPIDGDDVIIAWS